jgi:hypothetical protein
VAASRVWDASLSDGRGAVRPEFLLAALVCPSGRAPLVAGTGAPMLLGELAARLLGGVRVGEPCSGELDRDR